MINTSLEYAIRRASVLFLSSRGSGLIECMNLIKFSSKLRRRDMPFPDPSPDLSRGARRNLIAVV